jgi:hypothetical protein
MTQIRRGIAVIGAGNWGSSLATGVVAAGMSLVELVAGATGKRHERGGGVAAVSWETAKLDAEVLWICVPDGEIRGVGERIAARRGKLLGQVVVHSSGALTVGVLNAARLAGAGVGGIAPVFSFPTRKPVPLRGVLFAVEPGAGQARKLTALVRKLGGAAANFFKEQGDVSRSGDDGLAVAGERAAGRSENSRIGGVAPTEGRGGGESVSRDDTAELLLAWSGAEFQRTPRPGVTRGPWNCIVGHCTSIRHCIALISHWRRTR